MKKFVIQAVLLILVILFSLVLYSGKIPNIPFVPRPSQPGEVIISDIKIKVYIADDQVERSKGLGGRESLASNSGMLFIFPRPDIHPFWMKGMKFAIDMIWIRESVIVDIKKNVPPVPADTPDIDIPRYVPNQPADMVLEVNNGFADAHNIKVGDKVQVKK